MEFTYKAYLKLIDSLREGGYEFSTYVDWDNKKRAVILRHDIDTSIMKALKMAKIEEKAGVSSTYFVLVTSDFYNVFSKESSDGLKKILSLGHNIGLHFDEVRYSDCEGNPNKAIDYIREESFLLEKCIGSKVEVVSMHRPSKGVLEADLSVPGMINSYSKTFFKEFKYLSDSRRRWREPVEKIIKSGEFDRLHILTHAFWYNDSEIDIHDSIYRFVNEGNESRYRWLSSNITDLNSIMHEDEILR